ncbi:hypothetical protein KSP39_PZI002145 [Platanthera zijinensis]|uniref:Uncharacterized protein n=1 Tax=Platanthera zijinensis TaxID=2320716 RepID=A0AAP0BZ86_9ASPA
MTRIVFTIPTDWSTVIFEKIKEGIKKPNLARIMSLYLSKEIPDVMQQQPGTKINHMRRMDMRLFSRWDRVLTKEMPEVERQDSPEKSPGHATSTEHPQEEHVRQEVEDQPASTQVQDATIPAIQEEEVRIPAQQVYSPTQTVSTHDQIQEKQVSSPAQDIPNTEQVQGEKLSEQVQEEAQIDLSQDLNTADLSLSLEQCGLNKDSLGDNNYQPTGITCSSTFWWRIPCSCIKEDFACPGRKIITLDDLLGAIKFLAGWKAPQQLCLHRTGLGSRTGTRELYQWLDLLLLLPPLPFLFSFRKRLAKLRMTS